MPQLRLNNLSSRLTAAITAGATTVAVTAGDGANFAAGGTLSASNYLMATLVTVSGYKEIAWEIIKVIGRSTDTLTIVRAQEGTTALAFAAGDVIDIRPTAGGVLGLAFRNKFVNGAMTVDQMNAGAVQTFTAGAAVAYCVDQWYASCTGANITGQRVAATGDYQFTGATSNTGTLFGQRMESADCADLVSQTVVCQSMVSSSTLTSVTWTAYSADAADNFSAKTQIATGAITITSTPTRYSFTFNAGANAANGICIEFTTGALVAAATLRYGSAQLERAYIATEFEVLPRAFELERCQRFLEKSFPLETAPAQNTGTFNTNFPQVVAAAAVQRWGFPFKTRKRGAPAITLYNPSAANAQIRDAVTSTDWTGSSVGSANEVGFNFSGTTPGGSAVGDTATVNWLADARL